ncbi:MAG: hypothetical protein A2176_07945 [Spirochaetes bacterium RBG_13_51_14]|nr:MAG: hypothetical protein A2176_07945 [Spirochaetes bacterium RBG_13_51_14]
MIVCLAGLYPALAINSDQNPCGIKWRVIVTPHFKVIYPAEIEKDAERVAATLEHAYPHVTKTLKFKPRRLPVLLFTQSVESNGMSVYMPRRTEWWNTPPQRSFSGTTDWYTDLAIHEFRHIVQMDGLNRGFNRALYILFGETGAFVMGALSVPWWFIEGDAVGTETALTSSGRGRIPEFDVELRALLLSGKRYKYFKALFGSYRDWDPLTSPYLLGYYLTTHVKRNYGPDVWADMLYRATWCPFVPHWFDFMLISKTGSSAYSLYNDTMDEMEMLWRKQLEGLAVTDATPLHTVDKKNWTYNSAPQYASDGSIILLRYGMKDIYTLIKVDPAAGKETRLCYPGQVNFTAPSAGGGRVVWSEQVPDLRWGQRSYSVIVSCDLNTKKKKFLTKKTRLFAPALSPDGRKIAAVEFTASNECSLVTLDAETGALLKRFPNPENEFIQTPHWSLDGSSVTYCTIHRRNGKAVALMNEKTGTEQIIVPYTMHNIYYPVSDGTYIFFVSPYSGIDNIYAVQIATKKIFQVTSRRFGAYYPALSPDGKKLAFNDVTADGYIAAEMTLDPLKWIPLEKVEDRSIRYYDPLIAQEADGDITRTVPDDTYESRKFNHFTHLVNVHSWMPLVDPFSSELALTVTSRNLLNTTEVTAGYIYNWNERTHAGMAEISYAGWYPVIDAACFYGGRSSTYDASYYHGLIEDTQTYSWRELRPSLGVRFPFNLTRTRFSTRLTVGVRGSYTMVDGMDLVSRYWTPERNHNGQFIPISYFASLYNGYRWFADINPVWGQTLDIVYRHMPFRGPYQGSLLSITGTLYFPGILKHQSFFIQGGYERQTPHDYRFASQMLFARGYKYEFSRTLVKSGVNYTFPIYDPDWNLVHVLHFKRIFANLFGDYAVGLGDSRYYYRSTGMELNFELHFFTIEVPVILGVRGYYRFDQHDQYVRPYGFDFIFGIGMDVQDLFLRKKHVL